MPQTILIVDDDPDIVTYLSTVLQDEGFDCCSAADGVQGMAAVRSEKPALICLDISMPEKSGVRMYRDLCEDPELSSIPVVIVTGLSLDFEKFISTRKQVPRPAGYFAKPVERIDFIKKVKELLAG